MGVNLPSLELMALARASGADFSRVVTIGRHRLHIAVEDLEDFLRNRGRADLAASIGRELAGGYCEPLLMKVFGAQVVQSIDASDYEHADIIHDMNMPMAAGAQYSVVLDLGTLEHVFNVAAAFDNVAALAAPGAYVLHVLPSNNFVGHGFYQFSPEFFFQVYAPERGFAGTRVFAAPCGAPDVWYEVRAPRDVGARVEFTSRDQLHLLVLTQKVGEQTPLMRCPVQQSDYVARWNRQPRGRRIERRRGPLERLLRQILNGLRHRQKVARRDVSAARLDLIPRKVRALTARL